MAGTTPISVCKAVPQPPLLTSGTNRPGKLTKLQRSSFDWAPLSRHHTHLLDLQVPQRLQSQTGTQQQRLVVPESRIQGERCFAKEWLRMSTAGITLPLIFWRTRCA